MPNSLAQLKKGDELSFSLAPAWQGGTYEIRVYEDENGLYIEAASKGWLDHKEFKVYRNKKLLK